MLKKFLLTVFLMGAFFAAAPAQSTAEEAAKNARERFSDIKNRSIEMERMKREANKPTVEENYTLKFPKIKEDFERMQKINDDLFKLIAAETPLDNSVVSKSVSEINRRAARLRSNLFSTETEQKNEAGNKQSSGAESPDLKTQLALLDEFVNKFVHNSIFQNINLVNASDSLKAQKDLETVINISNAIKAKTKN